MITLVLKLEEGYMIDEGGMLRTPPGHGWGWNPQDVRNLYQGIDSDSERGWHLHARYGYNANDMNTHS